MSNVIFIDHSIISAGVCEEKQRLTYIEHLTPVTTPSALLFGSAWHAGVASLYSNTGDTLENRIRDAQKAFVDYLKEHEESLPISAETGETERRTIERAFYMIDAYAKKWASNDIHWSDIINKATGKPYVEVGFSLYLMDWNGISVCAVGKIDRIRRSRIDNLAYNWETKTTTRGVKLYAETVRPNHQYTMYSWAARELLSIPLAGNILDAVFVSDRKIGGKFATGVDPENDFGRFETRRSTRDIDEFLFDLKRAATRFLSLRDDLLMKRIARGERQTAACFMYGGCHFRELCNSNLSNTILKTQYKVKEWHPWKNDPAILIKKEEK